MKKEDAMETNAFAERGNALILSIQPEHASRIYSGAKRFELRKILPRTHFSYVYLSENGKGGITGCFEVGMLLRERIPDLWRAVGYEATSLKRFQKYFCDRSYGYAIEVTKAIRFDSPISIESLQQRYPGFAPPQSSMLLKPDHPLYGFLNRKRRLVTAKVPHVSLSRVAPQHRELYKRLIKQHVGHSYEEIDAGFAKGILKTHDLGYDPAGFLTTNKEVLSIKNEKGRVIGFTTLTYKQGGSVKTGPTILLKEFRRKGYGRATRAALEDHVRRLGMRKVYCTSPDNSFNVIKYLLSAGYRIEAHLDRHYSKEHGEIVFGKLIGPSTERLRLKKPRLISGGQLASPDAFDRPVLIRDVAELFGSTWFDVAHSFTNQLISEVLDKTTTAYEEKPKEILCLKTGDNCIAAVILLPKRGGAIKGFLIRGTTHEKSLKKLIEGAEKRAYQEERRKIYFLHPLADHEIGDLFISLGYRIEGLLRSPYVEGRDVFIFSKFFT